MSPLHMRSQVCMEQNNFTVQCRLCTAHGREQCWHKFSLNWSTMVTNAIICTHTNFLKHPIWVKPLKEHSGYENSNDHNMEPILQDLILLTIVYFYSGRPVKIVWELSRPLWFSAPRNVWTPLCAVSSPPYRREDAGWWNPWIETGRLLFHQKLDSTHASYDRLTQHSTKLYRRPVARKH